MTATVELQDKIIAYRLKTDRRKPPISRWTA